MRAAVFGRWLRAFLSLATRAQPASQHGSGFRNVAAWRGLELTIRGYVFSHAPRPCQTSHLSESLQRAHSNRFPRTQFRVGQIPESIFRGSSGQIPESIFRRASCTVRATGCVQLEGSRLAYSSLVAAALCPQQLLPTAACACAPGRSYIFACC